jgi:hypothetical protein
MNAVLLSSNNVNVCIYVISGVCIEMSDRHCGLAVRVLGYRSGGPGSIPGTTRFSGKKRKTVVGLERGPLSLVSTIEELLGRKSSGSGIKSREYGLRDPSR